MKIALISDVHSNVEALKTALAWIDAHGIERIYCLGDVVGYGADPNPCCDLIRQRCAVTLMGNHDAAVVGVMDTDYYYPAARDAIFWTRRQLTPDNFRWLYGLPYTHMLEDAGLYHAAPIRPSGFYYVVQARDAQAHTAVYDKLRTWSFVGHSHLTFQFVLNEKKAKDVTGKRLQPKAGRKFIVNVGSVGQPRDRDNRLCFGVYDTEAGAFEHVRLEYDIPATAEKIERAGLDEKFARRLFAGQ
ncbi:MAG: metallophosphoesterase family protein [Myxococcota bacterium]